MKKKTRAEKKRVAKVQKSRAKEKKVEIKPVVKKNYWQKVLSLFKIDGWY